MSNQHDTPRRLRLGMVGGGQGAFIGGVHRIAARLDDHYELVAGAFASDPDRSRAAAAERQQVAHAQQLHRARARRGREELVRLR